MSDDLGSCVVATPIQTNRATTEEITARKELVKSEYDNRTKAMNGLHLQVNVQPMQSNHDCINKNNSAILPDTACIGSEGSDSCTVTLYRAHNDATEGVIATAGIIVQTVNDCKPRSIKELRSKLKAKQSSCMDSLYREHNDATHLMQEFIEVDGVSETEAKAIAAVSIPPKPSADWLAMLTELDTLIDRYCKAANVPQASKEMILKARANQALINIPATLKWFRRQVGEAEEA